jgi:hypothetical protein
MIRQIILVSSMVGLAACAAPGPEPPLPSTGTGEAQKSVPSEPKQTITDGEVSVSDNQDPIVVAGEPGITDMPRRRLVCVRERRTGSHRAKRVCRTEAEIEKLRIEGQDSFEDLHRSQKEYENRE